MALPLNAETRKREVVLDILRDAPAIAVGELLSINPDMRKIFALSAKEYQQLIDGLLNPQSHYHKQARAFIGRETREDRLAKIKINKIKPTKALYNEFVKIDNSILLDSVKSAGKKLLRSVFLLEKPLQIPAQAMRFLTNSVAVTIGVLTNADQKRRVAAMVGITKPLIVAGGAMLYSNFSHATINPNEQVPNLIPVISTDLFDHGKQRIKALDVERTDGSALAYTTPDITSQFGDIAKIIEESMGAPSGKGLQDPHYVYRPFLDLIEKGESTVGGYNAVYLPYAQANKNTPFNLTNMTINQVRALQEKMEEDGFDSTAVGRYQIIDDTMDYLVKKMRLKGNEIFTSDLQDKMAITLLRRRGIDSFLSGKIKEDHFFERISKEWASFPKDKSGESYYDGVGNNKAHISYDEIVRATRESVSVAITSGRSHINQFSSFLANKAHFPIPQAAPRGPKNG